MVKLLAISERQYAALAEAQVSLFVARLEAAYGPELGRCADPLDHEQLTGFVRRALADGIEEEADIFSLLELRLRSRARLFERADAREILADGEVEGWLKVFQLSQLPEFGNAV